MQQSSAYQMQTEMQSCIKECLSCYSACLSTMQYSLQAGGKHAEAEHIRLLMDCAEICRTSADFMIRNSPFHGRSCAVCALVCEYCEASCAALGDDNQMQMCAATCRRCAFSCRRMAIAPEMAELSRTV